MRWQTPDAALRDMVLSPPQRARGIDPAAPRTGSPESAKAAEHAYTLVVCALQGLSEQEQEILIAYALGLSYRRIAAHLHRSDWWVRQTHRRAWEVFRARLAAYDLIPSDEPA